MKTLVVYVHLIAACVALGITFIQDLALARSKGSALSPQAVLELKNAADIVIKALIVLWVSGAGLITLGYLENPEQYLLNQKLWAKIAVVTLLTLNGIILHYYSFPKVTGSSGLLGLSFTEQNMVALTGAVSSVSWLFACFLGIARPWNYTLSFSFIMCIYIALIIGAFVVASEVMRMMRRAESAPMGRSVELNSPRKFD
jgi:hypothetical protein